jgi:hypothetical protein
VLRTFGRLDFLVTLRAQLRPGLCHHRLALAIGDQRTPPGDLVWLIAVANEIGPRELAEADADHGAVRTGLLLAVPGLTPTQQSLAVLVPGEMRLAQDLPEHCIERLRVGGGQVAQRQCASRAARKTRSREPPCPIGILLLPSAPLPAPDS